MYCSEPRRVPNTVMPSGSQASFPTSPKMLSGTTPAWFQVLVFSLMQPNSCAPQQGPFELEQQFHPCWLANQVNVVEESAELFTWHHCCRNLFQSLLDANGREEWHQWVALLATFCLVDDSVPPLLINPTVLGRLGIGHSHKWQKSTGSWHLQEPPQH